MRSNNGLQACVICTKRRVARKFRVPQIARSTRRVWVGKNPQQPWQRPKSGHVTDKYYQYTENQSPFCLDCWKDLDADGWILLSDSPIEHIMEDTRAVYCIFTLGKPLYAGQSLDLINRIASHNFKEEALARDKNSFVVWWDVPPILPIELETAKANLQRLREAEKKLIQRFKPELNKLGFVPDA